MSPGDSRILTLTVVAPLFLGLAFGQAKGSAPPPSSGNTGGTGGATGTTGSTTINPNRLPGNNSPNNTPAPTLQRPIFLNGRVKIDDGSRLPEPAAILRVCNGNPHTEGYTDSEGNFGIQFGDEQGVIQDAETAGSSSTRQMTGGLPNGPSTGGGLGSSTTNGTSMQRKLDNCELQARLAGFRSQSVMLVGRQPLDDPNVGTILLHRMNKGEEANSTVSATSLAAPKDARKAFDKGVELTRKNKVDDAFHEFQKAVMLYPSYATAWCELGRIEAAHGQFDIARGSFQQAVKADPKFVEPYLELSRIALNAKNWPELADFTAKALALDSFDYPQEFLFDAVAHYNMHDFETAEKSILKAESLDTRRQFPQISYLKGLVQLQHKEYSAAAENLRTYLKLAPNADDAPKVQQQLTELEKYLSQSAAKQ
ncbi:MAG TPA: tetratricopeptide repeat protein [Bryobacteraceae bacterium]|nr:tetratricopeptide repeat protein [Bryobacteraceae bacterium]